MSASASPALPAIAADFNTGYNVLYFGVRISQRGTPAFYCLVNEDPAAESGRYALYVREDAETQRYGFQPAPHASHEGYAVFVDKLFGNHELRLGTGSDRRMRLVSSNGEMVIEPLDSGSVTVLFGIRFMSLEQPAVCLPYGVLDSLAAAMDFFTLSQDYGPRDTMRQILERIEAPGLDTARAEDMRQVPEWCFALLRRLLSEFDELSAAVEPSEPVINDRVSIPLLFLTLALRQYMRPLQSHPA